MPLSHGWLKSDSTFQGGTGTEWSWALLGGVKTTKIKRSGGSPHRVFMVHSHTAPGQAFKKHFKASSSTWQPFIAWHQKSSLSFLVKIWRKGKNFQQKNLLRDEAQTVPKAALSSKKAFKWKKKKRIGTCLLNWDSILLSNDEYD